MEELTQADIDEILRIGGETMKLKGLGKKSTEMLWAKMKAYVDDHSSGGLTLGKVYIR